MLDKTYNAAQVEEKHYTNWEDKGYFEPDVTSGKQPYVITMPPPNVTGTLHVGHALDNTLPDMLIRRARMQGKDAMYLPGTDHASIAVHVVLDRQFKEEGITRFDLGREEFLKRAWKWKEHSHGVITNQMRRLGVGCAWQHERFTMDEGLSKAVERVFIELYNKGMIYRGKRMVNWDPNMQTAVSDLEVKHKEVNGKLWHFKYPLSDGSGHVVVATTRPETMLGDTAVAVNPEDERYKDIIGKTVTLPLVGRELPVIADDYVDMEFGTGVVKITPAHDFNDYEMGQRHDLEVINIITKEAQLNDNVPEKYRGMDRFEARKAVVADMEAEGCLIKIDDHPHNVAHAERDDTILEPFLTDQWFVKTESLAKKCLAAADNGDINFVPGRHEKVYRHWLNNIQDWCISRQLWWGHRIPAWYDKDGNIKVQAESPGEGWEQDKDILDTWFSSALWPFSTLGWPEKTPELEKYYPQVAIMPGVDILFFWVIRMMMMGLEFMEQPPFKTIYLHALVLDAHGQKMSKSKGNVMDPLELIEKYGTDALRYTLAAQAAPGQDIRLSDDRVENGRNFCTKLWNVARYAEMNEVVFDADFDPATATHPVNRWIVSELHDVITHVDKAFEDFRFNDVAQSLYSFSWNTFCDWYLELTKPLVYGDDEEVKAETRATFGWVLEKMLKLLHPTMPFITEEIWQNLTQNQAGESIMLASWPMASECPVDSAARDDINWLVSVVGAIRNVRVENKVPHKEKIAAYVRSQSSDDQKRLEKFSTYFETLANITAFKPMDGSPGQTDLVAVAEGFEVILPLEGIVDFEAEKERIQKEIAKFEAELNKIEGMLGNPSFVEKAPDHVVNAQQARKDEILADLGKLKDVLHAR